MGSKNPVIGRVRYVQWVLPLLHGGIHASLTSRVVGVSSVRVVVCGVSVLGRKWHLRAGQVLVLLRLSGIEVVSLLTRMQTFVSRASTGGHPSSRSSVFLSPVSALNGILSIRIVSTRRTVRCTILAVLSHGLVDRRGVGFRGVWSSRRVDICILVQWGPAGMAGSCDRRRRDFPVEPLPPSSPEAEQAKREDDTDYDETDDDEDTGDGTVVVEEGAGSRPAR